MRQMDMFHVEQSTPDYYYVTINGVKIDPYRIARLYNLGGGPREHMGKKLLRGTGKGQGMTELELVRELRGLLDRWEEIVLEDTAAATKREVVGK